jgi:sigma-B regulation protein RsbU (phosphoserine phosphatase)
MPNESKESAPSTTMRIDLSPEALEEARKGKSAAEGRRKSGPIPLATEPRAVTGGGLDFQQLLQNIYDAAIITDLSGVIAQVNVRANQFFGAEPGQLVRQNILSLISTSDESLLETIQEALKANRFVLIQAFCSRMDGSFFHAEISVNRLRLEGRDHLSFFVRDTTLRKEQEERLRTGHNALQNSGSGIVITGMDGRIEYWNPAFLSFFALTQGQVVEGNDFRDFLCDPEVMDEAVAVAGSGQTWSGEVEMKRADGLLFFGQLSAAANLNTNGEPTGMIMSVLDVTPQKLAQRQLETYASELHEKNLQMQEDLDIASELHRAFLPPESQVFPKDATADGVRLRLKNLYLPSGTIGGDFFDTRALSEHEVALFISDVMGHGTRSALVVATIRGLIEQLRPLAGDPGAFLTHLNASYTTIFKHIGDVVLFSTALYAVIDTRTGVLRCANASHPWPYVLRRKQSQLEQLSFSQMEGTAALGIFPNTKFATQEFQLSENDLLLLYTDGLSEISNSKDELYESQRLAEVLRENLHSPAPELVDALLKDAKSYSGRNEFEDDVCLVTVEVERLGNGGGE